MTRPGIRPNHRPLPPAQQAVVPRKPAVRFFTVDEVAKYLRVSRMTVYRMVRQRHGEDPLLPSYKVGRSIRVPASAVLKFLDGHQWNGTWEAKDNVPVTPSALPEEAVQLELFGDV